MVAGISRVGHAAAGDSEATRKAAEQNEKIARCMMKFLLIVICIGCVMQRIGRYVQKEEKLSP